VQLRALRVYVRAIYRSLEDERERDRVVALRDPEQRAEVVRRPLERLLGRDPKPLRRPETRQSEDGEESAS